MPPCPEIEEENSHFNARLAAVAAAFEVAVLDVGNLGEGLQIVGSSLFAILVGCPIAAFEREVFIRQDGEELHYIRWLAFGTCRSWVGSLGGDIGAVRLLLRACGL